MADIKILNNDIVSFEGTVGIGTASPSHKLHVEGSVNITDDLTFGIGGFLGTSSSVFEMYSLGDIIYNSDSNNNGDSNHIFKESNNELMRITSAGNVGIGTTSPSAKLHIEHANNTSGLYVFTESSAIPSVPQIRIGRDAGQYFGVLTDDGISRLIARQDEADSSTHSMDFEIWSSATNQTWSWQERLNDGSSPTYRMVLKNGKLGVNTTDPVEKLSVAGGNIAINNSGSFLVGGATGDTKIGRLGNTSGVLTLDGDGTRNIRFGSSTNGEVVRIDNTNLRVGIGDPSPGHRLTIKSDTLANGGGNLVLDRGSDRSTHQNYLIFESDSYSDEMYIGLGANSSDAIIGARHADLIFRTGAYVERMRIGSTGNVGIGTTAPSSKLQVDGDFNIANKYIYNEGTVATTGAGVANGSALTWKQGDNTINTAYNYRVRLTTSGTGTNSGATYLVEYDPDTDTYNVRMVSRSGSNSNHPLLAMSGSQMIAYTNHTTAYNIQYHVEAISVADNDGTLHNMGADYHWQRDVNTLYYEDGNVGIGTDAPSAPLGISKSVYGDFDSENFFRIKIQDQGGTNNDVGIGQTATGNMGFNITSGGAFIFNNGTSGEIATFDGGGLNLYGDDGIDLRAKTNGAGATIRFSDHSSGSWGQRGNLTYFHADGSSYGSGNAFVFTGSEANMTVLADGKLMFKEGLYIKPTSGTGGGTRIIDNLGNFYGGGANITAINASNISSGTLDGDRLDWYSNDGFTGTYSIVWRATNDLFTSSWFQIRGSDDTILTRNIDANGNIVLNGNLSGNLDNSGEGLSKIEGFIAEIGAENGENQFILPGSTQNELAGADERFTVTATLNGTATSLSSNVFKSTHHYQNTSVSTNDTLVITITNASFNHSSGVGIVFSSRAWRARNITIETTTDGTNWTSRGSVTNYSYSSYYVTFNTGSTATTGIRYTLTNFNTTSTRIAHLFANNYAGGEAYHVDKWYEDTKYNVLNIDSSGQTDNYYLRLREGGSDRFTVYENGNNVYFNGGPGNTVFRPRQNGGSGNFLINGSNVGIGTSSPNAQLHVYSSGNGEIEVERASGALINLQAQSAIGVIGTDSNHPLYLKTNAGTRVAITTAGRVGIGTTSPSATLNTNLSVEGTILAYQEGTTYTFDGDANIAVTHNSSAIGTGVAAGLLLANNNNSNSAISPLIAFSARSASNTYNHTYAAIYGQKSEGGADSNWNKGDIIFSVSDGTGPKERVRVVGKTGNVGIGVTDPLYKFEVDPNNSLAGSPPGSLSNTVARFGGSVIIESGKTLALDDDYVTHAMMKYVTGNGEFKYQIQGYYGLNFTTRSDASRMIIRGNDGYVGINTTTPSERLHVNGNIQADTYIFGAYTNAIGYVNADVHNWVNSTSTFNWVKIGSVNSSNDSTKLMVEINSWGDNNYPRQTTHHVTVSKYSVGLSLSNWKVAGSDYNSTLQLVVDSNLDVWVKRNITWNHRFLVKPLVVHGGATFNSNFTGSNITTTQPTGTPVLENNGAFRVTTSDLATVTHDYRYQIIRTDGVENIRLEDNGDVALANGGGKVAVGKASPTYDLDVDGEVGINSYIRHNGDSDTFFGFDAADSFKVRTGGTDRFAVTSDVNVNGTTDLNINGTSRRINFTNGTGYIRTTSGNALYLGSNSTIAVAIDSNQNVGIGETSVSGGDVSATAPRLHVRGVDTAGSYHLVGRFQAGNDSDNTGAAILINHSNDRGLLIRAGRKDSDRGVAYFDITSSSGATTNMLTMGKYDSDHFVGIGTETPSAKLHVSSGTAGDCEVIIEADTDNNNENDNPRLKLVQDGGLISSTFGINGDANNAFAGATANGTYINASSFQVASGGTLGLTVDGSSNVYMPGNVGIGVTSVTSGYKMEVGGTIKANGLHGSTSVSGTTYTARYQQYFGALQISLESSTGSAGTIQLGNSASTTHNNNVSITNGNLTVNGTGSFTGDVIAYSSSDKRLKDNVKPIENALDKVIAIGGYEFDWNDNQDTYEGHDVGVIAQEVEEVLPEVVETRKDGYKAVKYEKIVPLLIEAIKEQQKQIQELKDLINNK